MLSDAVSHLLTNLRPQVAGGVVAVTLRGHAPVIEAFGFADVTKRTSMEASSRLAFGSVTKSFAGALAAVLESDGAIDLDAPAVKTFPDLRLSQPQPAMTFTQLLSHSSGLPRHDFAWMYRSLNSAQLFDLLPHLSFASEPGQQFIYSNLGFHIFGEWLQRTKNKPWAELLQQRILKRLQLNSISDCGDPSHPLPAPPHERDAAGHHAPVTSPLDLSAVAPAGSLCGTLSDLSQWMRLFDQGGWDKPSQRVYRDVSERLLTETTPIAADGPFTAYGFGWIHGRIDGTQVLWHNGGTAGYSSHVSLNRETGAIIAVITNSNAELDDLAFDAHRILNGKEPTQRVDPTPKFVTLDERPLSGCAQDLYGTYQHPAYGTVLVKGHSEEKVRIQATLNGWFTLGPMIHIGQRVFSLTQIPEGGAGLLQIVFHRDALEWQLESTTAPIRFERTVPGL
jgi:CubicO group peptidase (beta-lactamase class C family)